MKTTKTTGTKTAAKKAQSVVKETAAKVGTAAKETAAKVEPAVKETAAKAAAAVKETAAKVEPAVKETAAKAAATVKETAAKAQTSAKAAVKKAAAKAEIKETVYLQYLGKEINKDSVVARVKDIWTQELGNKASELKSVTLYLKPEENAAYYIVNDEVTGRIDI